MRTAQHTRQRHLDDSLYTSPRNARGVFAENRFDRIGRDAIQVGHATEMRVEGNSGTHIGYPEDAVDIEGRAIPVGVDTAGNVDRSIYARNQFSAVNGKCFDLDGFHDGEVSWNVCQDVAGYGIVMNNTNPDMQSRNVRMADNLLDGVKYGGIFVIGRSCDRAQSAAEFEYGALRLLLHRGRARHVPQRDLSRQGCGTSRTRTRQPDRGKRNHRLSNGEPLHRHRPWHSRRLECSEGKSV